MNDLRGTGEMKDFGASTPLAGDVSRLYDEAFREFGALALWSSRQVPHPTMADVLAIASILRVEGNLSARRLAERLEALCRAAL